MKINNVNIYVITHGRPRPEQRRTTKMLDASGLDYYLVMNEDEVEDYQNYGVDPKQLVITTNKFEDDYMENHRTYPVDFHGAVPNREMCNIHARQSGVKYAVQLDDNIIRMGIRHYNIRKSETQKWTYDALPK